MYTCDTCKREISYEQAGSMNPDNGEPICRRCAVIKRGGNPDFKAQQLREKIVRITTKRLPRAHMELGKAKKAGRDSSWQMEIDRLNDLLRDCRRQLEGLEI